MTRQTGLWSSAAVVDASGGVGRGWGRNRYAQAAGMYPRRWLFRMIGVWLLVLAGMAAMNVYLQRGYYWRIRANAQEAMVTNRAIYELRAAESMAGLGAMLAVFVLPGVVGVTGHVRERVMEWRGTVVPGYRGPHVVVGAVLAAGVVTYVAGVFYVTVPYSIVGLLAACAWIGAVGGACAVLPPKGAAVVGMAAVGVGAFPEVRQWAWVAVFGFDGTRAALLLAAGVVGMAGTWVWLAVGRGERGVGRPEDLMLGEGVVRWRRRAGEDVTTMSPGRRVRLWRLPSSTGLMPAACAGGLLAIILILMVTAGGERRENGIRVAAALAAMSMVLPVAAVGMQWSRRLPGLGYEMSRPVGRGRFVRDAGLALAADWWTWWAWLTAAGSIGVGAAVYWTTRTVDLRFLGSPWAMYGMVVATSAAVQVAMYGVTVWVMRFQVVWAVCLVSLMGALVCWVPLVYVLGFRTIRGGVSAAELIVGVAVAGAAVTWDAYRRWVRVEVR